MLLHPPSAPLELGKAGKSSLVRFCLFPGQIPSGIRWSMVGAGRSEELFCGWRQPGMKHPGAKGSSQGKVWKARLEIWASRTFFHNLPAGQCWDGSGCDPWAGTPEDVPGMWGGFSMERQPWSSPCPGIQLGKASLEVSPLLELSWERHPWLSPLLEFGVHYSGSPRSLFRGLSQAARLIPSTALLPLPLSLPSFISSGNGAEHPLGKAWELCLTRSASPAGDGAGEAQRSVWIRR